MSSGDLILGLGLSIVVLGFAALINYSRRCYVNPGGFPCDIQYQVALLAPLYPLSGALMAIGIVVAIAGSSLIALSSIGIGTPPNLSTGKPAK